MLPFPSKSTSNCSLRCFQLACLGGFILFFGFFAFNAGSQASISQEGDAAVIGLACMNTIISGACGAITAMCTTYIVDTINKRSPCWSLLATINGGLAGMVSPLLGLLLLLLEHHK